MIAALYVETNGAYFDLPNVDPWNDARDARLYNGPYPVVAHPPCQRWGKMWAGQPLWIKRTGQRKKKGDDVGVYKVQDSDFPALAMEKYGRDKCRKAGLLAFKGGGNDSSARIHTPQAFRDILIAMAESAQ